MMSVKNINITRHVDLQSIIDAGPHLVLALDINDIWIVSLDTKELTVDVLVNAFTTMLEIMNAKSERILTFYMWFDEMANQLRFNVIEGHYIKLPFGAKIEIVSSPDDILRDFVSAAHSGALSWDDIIVDEDDCEKPFILKVFVSYIGVWQ